MGWLNLDTLTIPYCDKDQLGYMWNLDEFNRLVAEKRACIGCIRTLELEAMTKQAENSMWHSVADKDTPESRQEVLCAWQPHEQTGRWTYEVLVHWPDGVWTDISGNEIGSNEIPNWWLDIQPPIKFSL